LIGLTVEGRHAGKEDISDDAARPDIALVVIVLVKDLRSDVVRGAELFVEVTVRVVDERCTEINDLDLIEFLVGLEQDVLRLQITMDDVGLMAVVDARENLLHKDSSVALAELSALEDFIEELSALADFSDKVVTFLILKELVHLDDVGVVNFLKNVDLVEKHALLVVVHMALAKNLDCALGTRLSVHAHAHLSKRACTENLADSIVIAKFALSSSNEVGSTDAAVGRVLKGHGIVFNHCSF